METFVSDKGKEMIDNFDNMTATLSKEVHNDACVQLLLLLQEQYNMFCLSLETTGYEKTRETALYMKYAERRRGCKEGLKIGDYRLLAGEG